MPSPLSNPGGWTLRKLINNTYAHKETRTRFDYKQRDMVRAIRIEEVKVYNGKNPGEARTKFIIQSQSTPQYAPYYTKKDGRNRSRKRQMKFRHQYDVIIQLEELKIDCTGLKIRIGNGGRWDFGPKGKPKRIVKGRSIQIIEGSNYIRGICADFYFRNMNLYARAGILYGRDWTNGQLPVKANPNKIMFLGKHALAVTEFLLNRGILK